MTIPRGARGTATRILSTAIAALAVACGSDGAEHAPAVTRTPAAGETFFASLEQLTFGGQNAEAYFSPDGTELIFQRTAPEGGCDQQYVMNVDGTGLHRVSNGLGRTTCGYFYAGASRVLYSTTFHADSACPAPPDYSQGYVWALYDYDIYSARADGSDLTPLFRSDGYDAEATLSPDGRTIVFTSMRDGDLDIYTMGVDGANLRRLTTTLGYDGGPFFSHDGRRIVYRAWHPQTPRERADYRALLQQNLVRPTTMEIWIMDADGSDQHQVTHLGGANFAPYFHPDDHRIIFASNYRNPRSRNFDLYLIGDDGSGLTPVTTDSTFDAFPMFSPDGTRLVFASNRHGSVEGETNIFIAQWQEPDR